MKKSLLFIIFALFLVSLNLRISIVSISPVLELIRQDLQLSNGLISLLTSIPVICMGLFAFVASSIGLRFGTEKTIGFSLIIIGLATALRAFAHSPFILLFTAFLNGVGIAIAGPLISGYIKEKFPNRIGMMIGVYSVGMGVGSSISTGLMVPLETYFSHSWQFALASWSIFAVIALAGWYPIMKEAGPSEMLAKVKKITKMPLHNKKAWLFTLFFGLQSGIYYCISTWLAPIVQSMGFTEAQSGTLITLFSVVQMIFSFVIPLLADVFINEKAWFTGCTLFVLLGLFLLIVDVTSPWFSTIILAIGLGGLFPLALALPLHATSSAKEASAWTSMMQGFGYMLSACIPWIAGLTRDYIHYDKQVFVLMMILCLFMLVAILSWSSKKALSYQTSH